MTAPEPRDDEWLTPDGTAPERPTHVIAHLSDTHLTSAGVRYNKVLDADAGLNARRRRSPVGRPGGPATGLPSCCPAT